MLARACASLYCRRPEPRCQPSTRASPDGGSAWVAPGAMTSSSRSNLRGGAALADLALTCCSGPQASTVVHHCSSALSRS
jgi:hypothetical protein